MRYGENPIQVIEAVKKRVKEISLGLPNGVHIVPFYDRTQLIKETVGTLKNALIDEVIITVAVILLFLLHVRSSVVVASTLPLAIFVSFIAMYYLDVDSNIMSLSGIAIAIGTMVDMGIIMTENIYRSLIEYAGLKPRNEIIYDAAKEVGGAIITAVSTTIVSFIPVFFMESQEGKLFRPLAYTKSFALLGSVIVAITIVPLLCNIFLKEFNWKRRNSLLVSIFPGIIIIMVARYFLFDRYDTVSTLNAWVYSSLLGLLIGSAIYQMMRERLRPIEASMFSKGIVMVYEPLLRWILNHKRLFLVIPLLIVILGFSIWLGVGKVFRPVEKALQYARLDMNSVQPWVYLKHKFPGVGREFMPALDEGSFLYMPSLLPAASLTAVMEVLKKQDILLKQVNEVSMVTGKLGRAESALDPAPVSMIETYVNLKPQKEWRFFPVKRWYSEMDLPKWMKESFAYFWPEERRITKREILEQLREVFRYSRCGTHMATTYTDKSDNASVWIEGNDGRKDFWL